MYRRQRSDSHQLVITVVLIQDIIKENHEHFHVAHPGIQRTYNFISLNYCYLERVNLLRSI
jgi:hypothetical protein